jgi:hypothetical protein
MHIISPNCTPEQKIGLFSVVIENGDLVIDDGSDASIAEVDTGSHDEVTCSFLLHFSHQMTKLIILIMKSDFTDTNKSSFRIETFYMLCQPVEDTS